MTLLRARIARLATVVVGAAALVQLLLLVVRPERGLPGLLNVLAAHVGLAALVLAPVALLRRRPDAALAVGALVAVLGVRIGDEWVSLPPAQAALPRIVSVATWNLEVGSRAAGSSAAFLTEDFPDVVVLQELSEEAAAAIGADTVLRERYPHRELVGRADLTGMGVLSRFPIVEAAFATGPAVQTVTLDARVGRLVVVNAHPFPAAGIGRPGFDPRRRNAELDEIRQLVDGLAATGTAVVLAGDFNTSPTEPAFGRLVAGLSDVHAQVGMGPGWTWRPSSLEWLGLPLLRLDLVLLGPGLRAISADVRCPATGDHCVFTAGFSRPPDSTASKQSSLQGQSRLRRSLRSIRPSWL